MKNEGKKFNMKKDFTHIITNILSVLIPLLICLLSAKRIYALEIIPPEQDIRTRLQTISESLSGYTEELEDIQSELEARIEYVNELEKEAATAESILELSADQLDAIHSMLNEELDANTKKNQFSNILQNSFFCIVGMVVPPFVKLVIKKLSQKKSENRNEAKLIEAESTSTIKNKTTTNSKTSTNSNKKH